MPDNTPPLLVPIAAEALVVNSFVQNTSFNRWEMDYKNLATFESPTPVPSENLEGNPPGPGVHLHWALPRALTRGVQVQATATAEVSNGEVTGLTVVNGGYGYKDAPVVTIVGKEASGAGATAVLTNGIVTSLVLVNPGSGYTSPPQVIIAPSHAFSFPLVPNRWLVVRYGPADSAAQSRQTMAWLLQSDTISSDSSSTDSSQSNSFVDPFNSTPENVQAVRLGTSAVVLSAWAGESGSPQQLFLRAVGPGEATFAAFQPGVVNVFSFYDPISDPNARFKPPNTQSSTFADGSALSYSVIGWYSDATHDLLYGPVAGWDQNGYPTRSSWTAAPNPAAAWQALIDDLNWSVQSADTQSELPSQSLFHASVYGVMWDTRQAPPGGAPSTDKMTVAIGNTSTDALAAIVARHYENNQQDGVIVSLVLTAGGAGYTSAPTVTLSGGGGSDATATAQVENGTVVSLQLLTGGSGYTSAPTVSISGGGGSGAAATAQVQFGFMEAEWLEALQYGFLNTLNDADGEHQLDLQIAKASFGSTPGGTVWQIVAAQTAQTPTGQLSPDRVPPPPPLTADQVRLLGELNTNQRSLDAAQRLLRSLQWELYALWWKKNCLTLNSTESNQADTDFGDGSGDGTWVANLLNNVVIAGLDPQTDSSLYQQVVAQTNVVQTLMQGPPALPDPTNQQSILDYATSTLGLDPTKLQLKPKTMPSFYQPADPVVMVAGMPGSEKQGSLTGDDSLSCRFTPQAVTGVNVATSGSTVPVTASSGSLQTVIPSVGNPQLPAVVSAGINALVLETFFVDAANAASIVTLGLSSTDQPTITNLAAAMTAQTPGTPISTISTPLAASFAFSVWTTQPWSPLYLEWQVTFYPTVEPRVINQNAPFDDNWLFAPLSTAAAPTSASWVFDGTDYNWNGGFCPQTTGPQSALAANVYIGRTFLTPQSTYILIAQLKKYLEKDTNADLLAVEKLIDQIGDWNFLSQRMSGFVDQLIMRDILPNRPPDSTIADQVGEQYHSTPDPMKGDQIAEYGNPGAPFFYPVRGGLVQFDPANGAMLRVVDAFGQVVDLMTAGNNVGSGVPFAPVRGRGLAPSPQNTQLPQPSQLIQLPPRLIQTSRLNFSFISAKEDDQETGFAPDSNPVCGWVLPNHLDQGLAIYDSDGNAVGELALLADTAGNAVLRLLPAPDSPSAVSDPANITNKHLREFVTALLQRQDQGVGFKSFLQAVDETLWTVDPLGSRADQNLSVLIGRPLALVRAQLQFELDGQPVYNQSWPDTLQQKTSGVETIQFPIRLGSLELYDDGLMGYFVGDNYAAFNSVHHPDNVLPGPGTGAYLSPIGYDGNYITLPFDYPTYTTKLITMLLDPRGDVHAFTGILPVTTVSLPAEYFTSALRRMAVTFRTGPVLTDADVIRLPYPMEKNGTWSWIQRNTPADPQHWTDPAGWDVENIVKANQNARLPNTPARLLEGWLKLTPSDVED